MTKTTKALVRLGKVGIVVAVFVGRHRIPPAVRALFEFPVGMWLSLALWLLFRGQDRLIQDAHPDGAPAANETYDPTL
jgi:hypothetical protein